MPELPDVEIFRQYASRHALNKAITDIEYFDVRVLKSTKQTITRTLKGNAFSESRRRGKYMMLKCSGKWLIMHFGMTGFLEYYKYGNSPPHYSQMIIKFDNDYALAYISKRKLGRIEIVEDIDTYFSGRKVGEDAQNIKREEFKKLMGNKKGNIKRILMDQKNFSGIGNIYADEILYQEKLHPEQDVGQLDVDRLESLYKTMQRVLRIAIKHRAQPENLPDGYLIADRREGRMCSDCGGIIKKITVNGRGTYICPQCQKK